MIMKPEKIARMDVFGEHLHAWSGRRAQDQTLRWRAFVASSMSAKFMASMNEGNTCRKKA